MKKRNYTLHNLFYNRWFRLCSALVLAFGLFLIPITVQTIIHIPVTASPHLELNNTNALSLRLGATLVHATGGLTITKSAPATVEPGGVMTYTLTVTNDTGQDITDGFVVDTLPSEVTCPTPNISPPSGWAFACSSSSAVWLLIGTFANNTSVDFSVKVNVTQPLTGGHEIVNNNYVISDTTPSFFDAGPAVTTTVLAPAWSITKTVSSNTIQPGQTLVYTITATNIGAAPTSGSYTISDTIPAHTTFATASTEGLDSAPPPTWSFTDPLPASSSKSVTYSVTVNSPLADETSIVNDGYTVSGGNTIADGTNDPITVTVDAPVSLSITKTASSSSIGIGEILTYTLTVTNNAATAQADNVVITDTLSPYVTYQSAGFVGGATGAITDTGGNPIIWALANPIPANSSVQVTVTVQVSSTLPSPPTITNNFQASASNAVQVSDAMDVTGEPGPVDNVTLSLNPTTLSNLCETTVATALVRDAFNNPVPGVSVNIGKFGGAGEISPTSASGSTNMSGVFTATFQGTQAGSVTILALASGGSNPSDSEPLTINMGTPLPTSLNVTALPDPLSAGGAIGVVTATLTDCQDQPVSGETINLTLSDVGLATFPGSSDTANGVTNASGVMTATLTSTSTTTANGTVTITGTSSGTGWDLQDITAVTIQPVNAPALQISKSATPVSGSIVEPDSTIVYDIVLSNTGTAAATGIVITDNLDSNVNYVAGSLIGATGNVFNSGSVVTYSVSSNLGVGAAMTARITVTVATAAISGTNITNSATASDQVGTAGPSNIVSHQVISSTSTNNDVYLPIVLKN